MDIAEIDEKGRGLLFFGNGTVTECSAVAGQDNVFLLETEIVLERVQQLTAVPGQFYLLRSAVSSVQFYRPISVYKSEVKETKSDGSRTVLVKFLILQKGEGTRELCHLLPGEKAGLIGPLGNKFELPKEIEAAPSQKPQIAVIGGGIGVAPVANFASSLAEGSYDFYASFKSGVYGLENVRAANTYITTDDGSAGIKGMLPSALDADKIRAAGYKCLFACGPTPMLAYVQKVAEEAGVRCYLSLERKMLCGAGACLGCTIETKDGNRRVCKDGPVFDSSIVIFKKPSSERRKPLAEGLKPDLSVCVAGVKFKNPVIAASGTFGFGQNYRGFFDVNLLGGISSKGCTLEPRKGNSGERIIEVASGDINSIGLENPGIPHFIEHELPEMMKLDCVSIANMAGSDLDSYVKGAALLDATDVPMIELNISCPNVKAGGMAWGMDCTAAASCVSAVRAVTKKPLMVKLSPNAPDLTGVALSCIEAGADALSLINTIQATAIDIETGRPVFDNIRAGMCGPAIKPIALRMVYDVALAVKKLPREKQVPLVGIGGISNWKDAVEFIMAGATAVQVGTATFSNPRAMLEIIAGLEAFMQSHGYHNIEEMRGIALV